MPNETKPLLAAVCAIHSQYIHSALAPWYLAAAAQEYCRHAVDVTVLEHTVNQPDDEIVRSVAACPAKVIGLSCYIWNIQTVRRILPRLALLRPDVTWLLGGPEVSFCPEKILQELPMVAFLIAGEGERPFALLLDYLAGGDGDPADIPGVCYRTGDGAAVVKSPFYTKEEPPSPYTPWYFRSLKGRIAYLETSRGCPFSCAFCLSGRQDQVRFFSLDRAKADILRLANADCRTVKLVDRTFNCHKQRCYELISFLLKEYGKGIPPGVCFHFEVAADLFDEPTLRLLETAPPGFIQMEAGLHSFHLPTLQAVTRKTDLDALCRVIARLLRPGNIHIHIDLIAGLPYEDWDTFAYSFDRAYVLQPHMLQLGFLKLLYGARLRREADEYGYVYSDTPPYELKCSRWMTPVQLARLHDTEQALDRLYNSGRFRLTLAYALKATGMRPFELFDRFGEYAAQAGKPGMSLDDYTGLVLDWFSRQPGIDPVWLRDVLTCDSLRSRAGGLLPPCLRQEDRRPRRVLRELSRQGGGKKSLGRAAAMLYAGNPRVVAAEYTKENRNPVTGCYPLRFYPLETIL